MDFLEHFGVTLDYANGKATLSMAGCRYPLCLHQEPLEHSKEQKPESGQPENPRQLLEVSYHEWKSLARHKGAEASVVWVRETQVGADNFAAATDTEKLEFLAKCNFAKITSSPDDMARFEEVTLETAKNFHEDNKVID